MLVIVKMYTVNMPLKVHHYDDGHVDEKNGSRINRVIQTTLPLVQCKFFMAS